MEEIKSIRDVPEVNYQTGGHGLCAGCGAAIGLKLALAALGPRTIVVNTASCTTLMPTYPYTPFHVPWIHVAIENAGAVTGGIDAALRILKKDKDVNILCYIGDGSTYDIGIQALSAACERRDNFIWVCYNNESYANTGNQWNSATPYGAYTATTPTGRKNPVGNIFERKNMTKIMAAHNIPYVATICPSFPVDFINKVRKASEIKGPKFLDMFSPCIPDWGYESSETIELGRLAVNSCFWPLYEMENGKFKLNYKPVKKIPVKEFLFTQRRFKHLSNVEAERIQKRTDETWEKLLNGKFWET